MTIITREEYVSGKASHADFHRQFVSPATIRHVVNFIGAEAIMNSTDPHMNDIPLVRWDDTVLSGRSIGMSRVSMDKRKAILPLAMSFSDAGDYPTLAGLVCVAKEAARMFKESMESKDNT